MMCSRLFLLCYNWVPELCFPVLARNLQLRGRVGFLFDFLPLLWPESDEYGILSNEQGPLH